jgi:hypothetical protein
MAVWLPQEPATLRQVVGTDLHVSGSGHDLDRRPAVPNRSGKFQAVHAPWHLNVSEYDYDIRARFKNRNGLVRISRFDDFECLFDHFDGVHADQQFVFNNEDDWAFRHWDHRFATETIVNFFLRVRLLGAFVGYRIYLFEPFKVRSVGFDGCELQILPEIIARHDACRIAVLSIQSTASDKVHNAKEKTWNRRVIA